MVDGSTHPDVSAVDDQDEDAWARLQFAQLQRLSAIGIEIAEALSDQVDLASGDPETLSQLAITHARVARAVRQTLALEARLRRDLKAGLVARRVERKAEAEVARAEAVAARKAGLRRFGRQAISDHEPIYEQGGLIARLDERLEDLSDDEDLLLERPFSTLLIEICEALGVVADFTLWRHEPWAMAEVRDRPPNSEYARFHDDMIAEGEWVDEDDEEAADIDPAIRPDACPPP